MELMKTLKNKGFVLATQYNSQLPELLMYYAGKTYRFQGESYASTCTLEHAKVYKTKSGAEKAVRALDEKVWNYSFFVAELK
jgi:hypothetical protein